MKKLLSIEEVLGGLVGSIIFGLAIAILGHFLGAYTEIASAATGLSYWSWYALKMQDLI